MQDWQACKSSFAGKFTAACRERHEGIPISFKLPKGDTINYIFDKSATIKVYVCIYVRDVCMYVHV